MLAVNYLVVVLAKFYHADVIVVELVVYYALYNSVCMRSIQFPLIFRWIEHFWYFREIKVLEFVSLASWRLYLLRYFKSGSVSISPFDF